MLKFVWRVVAILMLGFFAFITAAMVFAARKHQEAVAQDPAADEVNLVASFAPLEFKSESHAFRGGNVTTWFGGGVLDLRDATLDPAGATIHTSAMFGGGALVVPETWNVETHVLGIGGAGDTRPKVERPDDAPTLRLEGTAVFGGWGVMSERPDRDHEEVVSA